MKIVHNRKRSTAVFWIIFSLFFINSIYPVIFAIITGFYETNMTNKWDFIGLKNFSSLLNDNQFFQSALTSVKFTLCVVIGELFLGYLLAALISSVKAKKKYIFILILPFLLPDIIVASIWKWILGPSNGLLNNILLNFKVIKEPVAWLTSYPTAFFWVVFICIWKGYAFPMLLFISAIESIQRSIYEASHFDGCGKIRQIIHISLPNNRDVILSTFFLESINWFKHYTIVFLLTSGGPAKLTELVSILFYQKAFLNYDFGYASAMCFFIFVICIIFCYVYHLLDRRRN